MQKSPGIIYCIDFHKMAVKTNIIRNKVTQKEKLTEKILSYLKSSSTGAMLNIVQDSALLEAIGCQMETVRFLSFLRRDALVSQSKLSNKHKSFLRIAASSKPDF